MRTFSKIYNTFWSGTTGRAIRKQGPLAQLLAVYMFSSPHASYMGIYRLPLEYITCDLGITEAEAREALVALQSECFLKYDEENEIVFVLQGAYYQYNGAPLKPKDKNVPAIRREYSVISDAMHINSGCFTFASGT